MADHRPLGALDRHHRPVVGDGDGQRSRRGVAVRVRDGVGEQRVGDRVGGEVRTVRTGVIGGGLERVDVVAGRTNHAVKRPRNREHLKRPRSRRHRDHTVDVRANPVRQGDRARPVGAKGIAVQKVARDLSHRRAHVRAARETRLVDRRRLVVRLRHVVDDVDGEGARDAVAVGIGGGEVEGERETLLALNRGQVVDVVDQREGVGARDRVDLDREHLAAGRQIRKRTTLDEDGGIQDRIAGVGDGELDVVHARADIRGYGGKDVREAIVFDIEERPAVLEIVVVEEFGKACVGAERWAAATNIADRDRNIRPRNEGDVDPVEEEGEDVVKRRVDKFVVLLGGEDEVEEEVAARSLEIELEHRRIFGGLGDQSVQVGIAGKPVNPGRAVAGVRPDRVGGESAGQNDA